MPSKKVVTPMHHNDIQRQGDSMSFISSRTVVCSFLGQAYWARASIAGITGPRVVLALGSSAVDAPMREIILCARPRHVPSRGLVFCSPRGSVRGVSGDS